MYVVVVRLFLKRRRAKVPDSQRHNGREHPTGLYNLRVQQIYEKKIVTIMWYSNDMFHCMFKAELVMLVSLKVPSGDDASK